jgi:hypothetical protein
MIINTTGPTAAIDTINNPEVVLQLLGSWYGNVLVEGSSDQSVGSWLPLTISALGGMDKTQIQVAGNYQLSVSTRYIRFNVRQLVGSITAYVLGRAILADSSIDTLDLAADEYSGVRLGVRVDLLKDPTGAIVPSDAPNVTYGSGSANNAILIKAFDTTGYQSLAVQLFGTFSATVTFYESNDVGGGWVAVAGWPIGGAALPTSAPAAAGLWSVPAVGRFFRATITAYTSGTSQISITPRQQPAYHADSVPNPLVVNASQVGGTNTVTAGVGGLQAIGGNIAVGTAPTSNPVPMGSIDVNGLTRRLLSDATGRLMLGGLLAACTTPNGTPPTSSVDATQSDGQSPIEILQQILVELRIQTLYLHQLPSMLQLSIAVGSTWDDPNTLRDPQSTQL